MKRERWVPIGALLLLVALISLPGSGSRAGGGLEAAAPDPTPHLASTIDPLATPVMPESPTQLDVGRNVYYYHCMPCHGDRGQGLTDEWREEWVHDHQNCWYRGCHSGRSEEEGFFIPHDVPAVMNTDHELNQFRSAKRLFAYLQENHPPQRPNSLKESEYWALTALILDANGRTPKEDLPGAAEEGPSAGVIAAAAGGVLVVILLILGVARVLES